MERKFIFSEVVLQEKIHSGYNKT